MLFCENALKSWKFWKIKNHCCLVTSWILENVGSLGGLDNLEYGTNVKLFSFY